MNEIAAVERTIMSMEVAEMVEKEHGKLIRDIKRYTNQLNEAKIGFIDFWKEEIYIDERNRSKPCYQITEKGCEFIAHKMTGIKGTVFTARYINRFHEMEEELKKNQPELEEKETSKLPIVRTEIRKAPRRSTWYMENNARINRICKKRHMQVKELYSEILKRLSKVYDIEACRVIYEKENGYPPSYAIDIIPYFKELEEEVDKYLYDLDYRLTRDSFPDCPFN